MKRLPVIIAITLMLMACHKQNENPLLVEQNTPYGVPAFDKIKLEHYEPAFLEAIKQQEAEIEAIVNNPEKPTFENTVEALERSGQLLQRVEGVFFNILEADGNDEMQEIAEKVTPRITELSDNIMLNKPLFARIKTVYDQRQSANLNPEQMRLLEQTYKSFVQSGANLSEQKKARLREINQQLSMLSLRFSQNVVDETNKYQLFLTDEKQLAGLPESAKQAAKEEAVAAGRKDAWLFTPKRTSFTPVLQYCENRALRKELLMAYTTRGNHDNQYDNKTIINQTMHLRTEKAQLFGYKCSADYILADCMAHNAATVDTFLQSVWEPSLQKAKEEAAALQVLLDQDIAAGKVQAQNEQDKQLQPWDWWFYAEKLRKVRYDLNEEELKPYFQLENVRQGAFQLASKLYGLQFEQLDDMPVYNPDVEVFKVSNADGSLLGIFYTDYFPRAGKRPGAWMNEIRGQWKMVDGTNVRPIIINVGNFTKPTAGNPSLLTMDDVETLFHEFGHALHGLLSQSTYHSLSGTSVPRDFVEMPSQLMENWCYQPEIMRTYAFHYKTGEVIPDSLIQKINNASKFNQGFVETELLSASILDMDYHKITTLDSIDVNAFEAASMQKMGMIPQIIVRYRSTFYNHIFTTGYEAGYYSYTWAAVLDSDVFHAFVETGDLTNNDVANRLRHEILERGNTQDAAILYQNFRGKAANPDYLLEKKGLK